MSTGDSSVTEEQSPIPVNPAPNLAELEIARLLIEGVLELMEDGLETERKESEEEKRNRVADPPGETSSGV